MTNLTEQWKKGELPEGDYWCLSICGDVDKLYCYQNSFWKYKTEDDYYGVPVEVKQVLAPVPSYEEYQAKLEENKRLKHDVGNLGYKIKNQRHEIDNRIKEIEKLKSLLKESRFLLGKTPCENMSQALTFNDVINRIDQVLGEE